jgi:hypothetical protein
MSDARHIFLALTNPALGREEAFDRWYDNHVLEVLERYPGFVSGRRYTANAYQVGDEPLPWQHLALYEVRSANLAAMHAAHAAILRQGGLTDDGGVIAPDAAAWTYEPLGSDQPAPSSRHAYLALTNPKTGRDDEFNAWYDEHHLPEIVHHTPGFLVGQRFERAKAQRPGQDLPWRYIALYDVAADDIQASLDAIVPLIKERAFTSPRGALDPGHASWTYTAIRDRVGV